VNENGDGATDGDGPGKGAVPRLTIGQRVLASLPNLQRPTTAAPSSPPSRPGRGTGGGEATVDEGDVVTPDDVLAPDHARSPSPGRRRDALMKPPAPRPQRGAPSGMTKDELNRIIKRIDDREQLLAYSSAVLGVVVGVVLTVAAVHVNPPVHHKGHETAGFIVYFEGGARVLLSAVVALAAWRRRRSFVGFALLFLGTSLGFLFALPFWALGVWMIFRVLKWQKELAAMTGGPTRTRTAAARTPTTRTRPEPAARGRDAAEARRRARAERLSARTASGRRAKKQPEPKGPPPNKRYTPPKPPRPRPPAA